jgi:hypothetical protein
MQKSRILTKNGHFQAHVMHHGAACVVERSTRADVKRVVVDDCQTLAPSEGLERHLKGAS